jgi:hypothetical protein
MAVPANAGCIDWLSSFFIRRPAIIYFAPDDNK